MTYNTYDLTLLKLILFDRFEAFSVVVSPGVFYLSYNQLEDLKEGLSQGEVTR